MLPGEVTPSHTTGRGGKGSSERNGLCHQMKGTETMGQVKAIDAHSTYCSHFTSEFAQGHTGNKQIWKSTWPKPRYGTLNPLCTYLLRYLCVQQVCEKEKIPKLLKSSENHQMLELKVTF